MIKFTLDELYTTIVTHLKAGGKQSLAKDYCLGSPQCMYHGTDGAKCFIGLMITDEMYDPSMENGVASSDLIRMKVIGQNDTGPHSGYDFSDALSKLQEIHDTPYNWEDDGEFAAWGVLEAWAKEFEVSVDNC